MRLISLGAAAALAVVAQAFLLPPTFSSADSDIVNTLPFEDAAIVGEVQVGLSCPGCPVGNLDLSGHEHTSMVKNLLELDFQIIRGETDRLQVNGIQLYPVIEPMSNSFMETLTAPQLVQGENGEWKVAAEPTLGYSMGVKAPLHSKEDGDLDLVIIHMEIIQVGNAFVQGIPALEISLVRTSSGKLMLGNAITLPVGGMELTPSDSDQKCATLFCKYKAIWALRLAQLKGCHKSGKAAPRPDASVDAPKDHDARPHHHHRPHGHNHHHCHKHCFLRFIRNLFVFVLLPITVGFATGLIIYAVLSLLKIFIFRVFFRRDVQYQPINPEEVDNIDEKSDDGVILIIDEFVVPEKEGPSPSYLDIEKA